MRGRGSVALAIVFLAARAAAHCPDCTQQSFGTVSTGGLSVYCYPKEYVHEGEILEWISNVSGGSGKYDYQWADVKACCPSGQPLAPTGTNSPVLAKSYTSAAWFASVTVTDQQTGQQATAAGCYAHVLPKPGTVPTPSRVRPIVWFPEGVSFTPGEIAELTRVWRGIRAGYYHLYNRTFVMDPLVAIQSNYTEQEICGDPDCSNVFQTGAIVGRANTDVGNAGYPAQGYVRARNVMAWGAGAHAGSFGWDIAAGTNGDFSLAPLLAGRTVPPIEPNWGAAGWLVPQIGNYIDSMSSAVAHELNHAIGCDEPHDFRLFNHTPTPLELFYCQKSPWLTEIPDDVVRPTVSIASPTAGATISGSLPIQALASDETALDAVVFLANKRFLGSDTTPSYTQTIDTRGLPYGRQSLQAMAYDAAGNTQIAEREVLVRNDVTEGSCGPPPLGYFHLCFFNGTNPPTGYLGTVESGLFHGQSSNAGVLIQHAWQQNEQVYNGQVSNITGLWKGDINFVPGQYLFMLRSNGGPVELLLDGTPVISGSGFGFGARQQAFLTGVHRIQLRFTRTTSQSQSVELLYQPYSPESLTPLQLTLLTPSVPPEGLTLVAGEPAVFEFDAYTDDFTQPATLTLADARRGVLMSSIAGRKLPEPDHFHWRVEWTPPYTLQNQKLDLQFTLSNGVGETVVVGPISAFVPVTNNPVFTAPAGTIDGFENNLLRIPIVPVSVLNELVTVTPGTLPPGAVFKMLGDSNDDGWISGSDMTLLVLMDGTDANNVDLAHLDLDADGVIGQGDRNRLTRLLSAQPEWQIAWIPSLVSAGTYTLSFTGSDPFGMSSRQVTVNVANLPEVTGVTDRVAQVGELVDFRTELTDDLFFGFAQLLDPNDSLVSEPYFGPFGDVDLDRQLSVTDANMIQQIISNTLNPSPLQARLADVNDDGAITTIDRDAVLGAVVQFFQPAYLFQFTPTTSDIGVHHLVVAVRNAGGAATSQRFTLIVEDPSAVAGHVMRIDGAPVPQVLVSAQTDDDLRQKFTVLTGPNGEFAIHNCDGVRMQKVKARRSQFRFTPSTVYDVDLPDSDMLFETDSFSTMPTAGVNLVAGQATNFGVPVPDAEVQIKGKSTDNRKVKLRLQTGPSGEYVARHLPDGKYQVKIKHDDVRFEDRVQYSTVQNGQTKFVNFEGRE